MRDLQHLNISYLFAWGNFSSSYDSYLFFFKINGKICKYHKEKKKVYYLPIPTLYSNFLILSFANLNVIVIKGGFFFDCVIILRRSKKGTKRNVYIFYSIWRINGKWIPDTYANMRFIIRTWFLNSKYSLIGMWSLPWILSV